ncbi:MULTISPECIES: hypothetical protein [Xanthomonas]|uniref:hypothetical protein n=1 Tax=Xanthomonas TaxID=338 RepID=UPI001ADA8D3C|nr:MULTISPECIES: hypothetical protein [unclassified Xanthomonas]MBO9873956.1 hypothetical protein [Xanthomonas sp. D-93]WNH43829.1 hypothetical protein PG878_15055 [Xanthomonas sp. A6251]
MPFIESEYKAALSGKGASPELVIVMTRSGKMRDLLSHHLPGKNFPGLKVCTYHQAKGLEADTAILIEDCWVEGGYSLRNLFYAASGLYGGYTYDAAARDEALRLGYVGVTRGRKKVFWQVPKVSDEGAASSYRSS